MTAPSRTSVSRLIHAPPEAIYRVFLDRDAVAAWLPPDSMRGIVHAFDPREGGAFNLSLIYLDDGSAPRGKTSGRTDTLRGRFVTLIPDAQIEWAVEFESADPSFAGTMTVRWTLQRDDGGTRVTAMCDNIPPGIRPQDNEAGSRSTLEKLARFVGG